MGAGKENNDNFLENFYKDFDYISVTYGGHPLNRIEYVVPPGKEWEAF